ncbi:CehA/McbA family metallohydrolase [Planotetraspora sp. A-T 1434]|uniref:CehA/McbA family metallohydrolase n=1 Tax=Planotetraspora sp. A-T 1434 TaxID=2979219 RepID=UPI0021C138FB|nr:CehA/McbA family metallohydrolase [Planotetraspora sp. A-T 1434]MCT9935059.1 CehA/McbA family metallohydrolase [Planotetraspora sp. A-T 1434]
MTATRGTAIRGTAIRGTWTLDDRADATCPAAPVREVTFEVPPGTAALTVRLTYDRSAGVLDLGCSGPGGFRGWSGGARSEYTIAPAWATPGYLPGEVEPGLWHVLIGLHRVPLGGLPYEITFIRHGRPPAVPRDHPSRCPRAPRAPHREAAAARRGLPGLGGLRWLAGDLHAHTTHSDGALGVYELACVAAERGLDFLAVTDHNTISHHAELPAAAALAGIVLIPGQEITTDLGHANAFGDIGWIDFRRPPGEWAKAVQERGGILSINHPVAADCAWRHPMDTRPRTAEVWHSSWWDRTWGAPLAWGQTWADDLVVVGGGDYHTPEEGHPPGAPATWVLAHAADDRAAGPDAVLEALAEGRTAVSASPGGPLLLRHGEDFLVVDGDGLVLWGPETRRVIRGDRVRLAARPGIHRLETPSNEVMALCG